MKSPVAEFKGLRDQMLPKLNAHQKIKIIKPRVGRQATTTFRNWASDCQFLEFSGNQLTPGSY